MIVFTNIEGQRVLNTRPKEQANSMNHSIKAAKGHPIAIPMLNVEPLATSTWLNSLPPLSTCNLAIFTSHHAVTHFMNGLTEQQQSWPASIVVIAIGEATRQTLIQRHIHVHHLPTQADSEHLLELPSLQHVQHKLILLIKGEGGRTLIPDTLQARKAQLSIINVYRRTLPIENQAALIQLWKTDGIDSIVFTSEEAMQNIFLLLPQQAHQWIQSKPCFVLSKRLAEAATDLGIKTIRIC